MVLAYGDMNLLPLFTQQMAHEFYSNPMHVQTVQILWNDININSQVSNFMDTDYFVWVVVPSLDPHFNLFFSMVDTLCTWHLQQRSHFFWTWKICVIPVVHSSKATFNVSKAFVVFFPLFKANMMLMCCSLTSTILLVCHT